jgi:hypothetical protein
MILNKVNIQNELQKQRDNGQDLLNQFYSIFSKEKAKETNIIHRLKGIKNNIENEIVIDETDLHKIFTLDVIEKICVKYRLRFLHSKYFKSEVPFEAIIKIKELEKKYSTEVKDFYVLAPFSVFDLKDINEDPLLFAKLGDGKFYLVHKWGNDLNFGRSILNFPFRSIYHFFLSNFLLAFIFSMSFPLSVLNVAPENEGMMRLWFCTHCLIAFFSFFLFIGSLTFNGFSSNTWNSKYYNGN